MCRHHSRNHNLNPESGCRDGDPAGLQRIGYAPKKFKGHFLKGPAHGLLTLDLHPLLMLQHAQTAIAVPACRPRRAVCKLKGANSVRTALCLKCKVKLKRKRLKYYTQHSTKINRCLGFICGALWCRKKSGTRWLWTVSHLLDWCPSNELTVIAESALQCLILCGRRQRKESDAADNSLQTW